MSEDRAFSELLRKRSLRATKQRLDVLKVVNTHGKAIPYSLLRESLQDFDRVTLYRTINTLLDSGIIHKALVDSGETYYALCNISCSSHAHHHEHVHFKCESCQEVTCVETGFPSIEIPGYQIEAIKVEATGKCQNCAVL